MGFQISATEKAARPLFVEPVAYMNTITNSASKNELQSLQ